MIVYMIEDTRNNTYYTNQGFKEGHGNLYRSVSTAQRQINSGKLAIMVHYGTDGLNKDVLKIVPFNLERVIE